MGAPRLVYVEGPDDKAVVIHVAKKSGFSLEDRGPRDFEVKDQGGLKNLLKVTRQALDPAFEIERLGIVLDFDKNEDNNWGRLAAMLAPYYELPPAIPRAEGMIFAPIEAGRPIVGIWLMPDNQREGALEAFIFPR